MSLWEYQLRHNPWYKMTGLKDKNCLADLFPELAGLEEVVKILDTGVSESRVYHDLSREKIGRASCRERV